MSSDEIDYNVLTVDPGITQITEDVFATTGVIRFLTYLHVPHRMTILRIPETRDLVVYSPFNPDLVDLSSLGTVKAIVAPNYIHSTFPQKFLAAHPQATLYSSDALPKFYPNREWGTVVHEDTPEDVISPHVLIKKMYAVPFKELVLIHVPSGTVVVADLAFNLNQQMLSRVPLAGRIVYTLISSPRPLDIHTFVRQTLKPHCKDILPQLDDLLDNWEWDRCIPCHGEVMQTGAKEAFRNGTYRYVKRIAEGKDWSRGKILGIGLIGALCAVGAGVFMQRRGFIRNSGWPFSR